MKSKNFVREQDGMQRKMVQSFKSAIQQMSLNLVKVRVCVHYLESVEKTSEIMFGSGCVPGKDEGNSTVCVYVCTIFKFSTVSMHR